MYQLNLNQRQARVVIEALDVLARIGMGQLEIVAEHIPKARQTYGDVVEQSYYERRAPELVRQSLDVTKAILGHERGGSYGIGHPDTTIESKIAFDLECVLRKAVATVEKHDEWSVWHRDPLHYGTEPLATVEIA